MKKEKRALHLNNLTKEDLKNIAKIIVKNNNKIYENTLKDLTEGVKSSRYEYLTYNDNFGWERIMFIDIEREITFAEFKQLFKNKNKID